MAQIPEDRRELIAAAEKAFGSLRAAVAKVSELVLAKGAEARVYELPEPMDSSSAEQDFKTEIAPQQVQAIEVTPFEGAEAVQKASRIYSRLIRWAQQSPNHTIRLAGVVCVPDPSIIALVAHANTAKADYEAALRSIHPTSQTRRKIIDSSELANVHFLQARRDIVALPRVPDRVGFTWEGQHRSVSNITAGDLRTYIVDRFGALQRWGSVLEPYGDQDMLAIVQEKAPSPAANIGMDGTYTKRTAVMPFIVVGERLPKISPLEDYARRDRPEKGFRQDRRARVDATPLIPELNVHRFEYWAPRD